MITANFSVIVNLLAANFTDTSLPEINTSPITSWLWDFGDMGTSNLQNPNHVYAAAGVYIVKLTVGDGTRVASTIKFLLLSATANTLLVPIIDQVKCKIPGYDDDMCLLNAIRKWQLILQYAPTPPIADADVFDETKWPALFNALIASLVVYELLIELFNQYTLTGAALALQGGSSSSSSSSSSDDLEVGPIKKLETGPSSTEWFNPTENNNTETGSKLITSYFKDGSLMTEYKNQVCLLASRLGVYLPEICECKSRPILPITIHRDNCVNPDIYRLTNCISRRHC